ISPEQLTLTVQRGLKAVLSLEQPKSSRSGLNKEHNRSRRRRDRSREREREMEGRNLSGFLIGCLGTALTLGAYSQTLVSSTQCIAIGLLILMFGLFVKEGFLSL
ncbi:unnamed protein product, partial [Musa hybrid cultivar]